MYKHEIKKCPRCQTAFECKPGNIVQCQCYGIALTAEQRAYIEQHYADCLCRNCLQQLTVELHLFKEKYVFR
ncbi:MAG: cysteine-rich CWC family protein [Chitinophagaceae bacterium]|nr:cysteine-rich CWC family protein [Chitinophagaceae bacterium]